MPFSFDARSHILIIDDQPINVSSLKAIFFGGDYRVSSCTRGSEVMEAVKKDRPELILLDILMPEMDGYEVCRLLKENPDTARIPVIFITALREIDSVVKCFELGGADYIIKPFNHREVMARVNTHLKLNQAGERLKKLNEWKDNLLSIISHDMRGPFNNFCVYIELLKDNIDNPVEFIREHSDDLNFSINNMKYMMENILEWAISQRDGFELTPSDVSIAGLCDECFSVFRQHASAKGVTLRSLVPDDAVFRCDRQILLTALRNLVQNALKYTSKGGTVEVSAAATAGGFEISVSDDGVGMAPEKIEKLFAGFKNSSAAGTGGERGAGVGLAICFDLLAKCGGKITVKSEPGRGSVFTITAPKLI